MGRMTTHFLHMVPHTSSYPWITLPGCYYKKKCPVQLCYFGWQPLFPNFSSTENMETVSSPKILIFMGARRRQLPVHPGLHADHKGELVWMAWTGTVSSSSVNWLYIPRPFPPTPSLPCVVCYSPWQKVLYCMYFERLHKYHRICNAFTKLPTMKPGTSLKKRDSQDFSVSNRMQDKPLYLASLAYGMEILLLSLCSILNRLAILKGFSPSPVESNELNGYT